MKSEVKAIVKELMLQATDKEKETFDKIVRSDEEKVYKAFGIEKDDLLESFLKKWAMRAME